MDSFVGRELIVDFGLSVDFSTTVVDSFADFEKECACLIIVVEPTDSFELERKAF